MKKGFSIGLAIILMLTLTAPAFADGELLPALDDVTETEASVLPAPTNAEPPESSVKQEQIEIPEGASEPEETKLPEETATPEGPELPEETPMPEEPGSPEGTSAPEKTELPEDTESPEETSSTEENIEQLTDDFPIIDVTVSEFGRILINPYGLPMDMNGETFTEQIVSETLKIVNHSEVPVTVWSSAVGSISPSSVMTYASEPSINATEKEIFLYAEFQAESGTWSGMYSDADNQISISEQVSEPKAVLTLGTESEGMFRFFGAASVAPNVPWCAEDVLSITFSFTFSADGTLPPHKKRTPPLNCFQNPCPKRHQTLFLI